MNVSLHAESQTLAFCKALYETIIKSSESVCLVLLYGNLGMGKTTLTRGVLNAAGYNGPVKSPTYTLVETYDLAGIQVNHFDLYRLGDPEELEFMGIRDYFSPDSTCVDKLLCIVEWPERAAHIFPPATFEVRLDVQGEGRSALITANPRFQQLLQSNLSATDLINNR